MDANIGVLWGEPGIGKSALLNSVSEWWHKTFLIRGNFYLNLDGEDVDSEF